MSAQREQEIFIPLHSEFDLARDPMNLQMSMRSEGTDGNAVRIVSTGEKTTNIIHGRSRNLRNPNVLSTSASQERFEILINELRLQAARFGFARRWIVAIFLIARVVTTTLIVLIAASWFCFVRIGSLWFSIVFLTVVAISCIEYVSNNLQATPVKSCAAKRERSFHISAFQEYNCDN